jgi:hypothetical protein
LYLKISGNQLKYIKKNHAISTVELVKITPLNRQLMPWNIQIQFSYLHSNVIMCIATLLTRWRNRQSSKISHDFQPWNWYHEHYSIVQSQTRDIRIVFLQDKFQNTAKLILELFQGYLFEWKMPVLI